MLTGASIGAGYGGDKIEKLLRVCIRFASLHRTQKRREKVLRCRLVVGVVDCEIDVTTVESYCRKLQFRLDLLGCKLEDVT